MESIVEKLVNELDLFTESQREAGVDFGVVDSVQFTAMKFGDSDWVSVNPDARYVLYEGVDIEPTPRWFSIDLDDVTEELKKRLDDLL